MLAATPVTGKRPRRQFAVTRSMQDDYGGEGKATTAYALCAWVVQTVPLEASGWSPVTPLVRGMS